MHRIVLLAYEGIQILDVTGAAAVFGAANDASPQPAYDVPVVSAVGGNIRTNCGLTIGTISVDAVDPATIDTLLVAGGSQPAVAAAARDERLRDWSRRVAATARRFGSVCSGTFLLAAWGLLDGRRVTTHWQATAELARRYPALTVEHQALYIEDGPVWTSAGVTTGIDMSLALVERDLGAAVATDVARRLVLYARRPGNQSQFSTLLDAQAASRSTSLGSLIDWMAANLDRPLDVETLAARAGLSLRSFHRKFVAATGKTPAAFVEALRLERARLLLGEDLSLKQIAAECGFGSGDRLTRVFIRAFGLAPSTYRTMHGRRAA